jgi:hypothetical protein
MLQNPNLKKQAGILQVCCFALGARSMAARREQALGRAQGGQLRGEEGGQINRGLGFRRWGWRVSHCGQRAGQRRSHLNFPCVGGGCRPLAAMLTGRAMTLEEGG